GPWIGAVELDVLDVAARGDFDAPTPAFLQTLKDLVLNLQVPRVVVLAGLQHGARGRDGVAAPLHLDRVEVRPVGQVEIRIELAPHEVAWRKRDKPIRTGADRLEVGRCIARLVPFVSFEQVLGDEHSARADESIRPERRRLAKWMRTVSGSTFSTVMSL